MTSPVVNVSDARGLSFSCQPGCGFCCTATPLVLTHEALPLGSMVVRADDGTLRIPISGVACSALRPDQGCGVYENRPSVCHLYPFQVHAGRRIQVTLTQGCPGVVPSETDADASGGAVEAAELALKQPGAAEMAAQAKETFAEFDRRMQEWGVQASADRLRSAFVPHLPLLARPESLAAFFAGLAPGDLLIEGKAPRAVDALFAAEPVADLSEMLLEAAADAFDAPDDVIWVESSDYAWSRATADAGRVRVVRRKDGVDRSPVVLDVADVPTDWTDDAVDALARYLERLAHRDHTEGAAAWLVDKSGYQVTPAAAFGRVLGEAALQVVLRAGLFAAEDGKDEIDAALAQRGVSAYETAFHSLPTLGSVL